MSKENSLTGLARKVLNHEGLDKLPPKELYVTYTLSDSEDNIFGEKKSCQTKSKPQPIKFQENRNTCTSNVTVRKSALKKQPSLPSRLPTLCRSKTLGEIKLNGIANKSRGLSIPAATNRSSAGFKLTASTSKTTRSTPLPFRSIPKIPRTPLNPPSVPVAPKFDSLGCKIPRSKSCLSLRSVVTSTPLKDSFGSLDLGLSPIVRQGPSQSSIAHPLTSALQRQKSTSGKNSLRNIAAKVNTNLKRSVALPVSKYPSLSPDESVIPLPPRGSKQSGHPSDVKLSIETAAKSVPCVPSDKPLKESAAAGTVTSVKASSKPTTKAVSSVGSAHSCKPRQETVTKSTVLTEAGNLLDPSRKAAKKPVPSVVAASTEKLQKESVSKSVISLKVAKPSLTKPSRESATEPVVPNTAVTTCKSRESAAKPVSVAETDCVQIKKKRVPKSDTAQAATTVVHNSDERTNSSEVTVSAAKPASVAETDTRVQTKKKRVPKSDTTQAATTVVHSSDEGTNSNEVTVVLVKKQRVVRNKKKPATSQEKQPLESNKLNQTVTLDTSSEQSIQEEAPDMLLRSRKTSAATDETEVVSESNVPRVGRRKRGMTANEVPEKVAKQDPADVAPPPEAAQDEESKPEERSLRRNKLGTSRAQSKPRNKRDAAVAESEPCQNEVPPVVEPPTTRTKNGKKKRADQTPRNVVIGETSQVAEPSEQVPKEAQGGTLPKQRGGSKKEETLPGMSVDCLPSTSRPTRSTKQEKKPARAANTEAEDDPVRGADLRSCSEASFTIRVEDVQQTKGAPSVQAVAESKAPARGRKKKGEPGDEVPAKRARKASNQVEEGGEGKVRQRNEKKTVVFEEAAGEEEEARKPTSAELVAHQDESVALTAKQAKTKKEENETGKSGRLAKEMPKCHGDEDEEEEQAVSRPRRGQQMKQVPTIKTNSPSEEENHHSPTKNEQSRNHLQVPTKSKRTKDEHSASEAEHEDFISNAMNLSEIGHFWNHKTRYQKHGSSQNLTQSNTLLLFSHEEDGVQCGIIEIPPQNQKRRAVHSNSDILLTVLGGQGVISRNREKIEVESGALLVVHRGSTYSIKNTGQIPLRVTLVKLLSKNQ